MTNRPLKSWNRFLTRHLAVVPEVMGKQHCFTFGTASILLKLPALEDVDRGKGFDDIASVGCRRATDDEPMEFHVHAVDVEVSAGVSYPIPSGALTRPLKAIELFSKDEQEQLKRLTMQHQQQAETGFQYWLRIMRWICDDHRIGRDEVSDFHSGWSTYLVDMETTHTFWCPPCIVDIEFCRPVTHSDWTSAQQKLTDGSQPPVYVTLKHDAQMQLELGDYRRALVDMAIACETYLRAIVIQGLPNSLNSRLVEYIEDGNIRQFIEKFVPEYLDEAAKKEFKRLKSDLHSLFDTRNKLMHLGSATAVDGDVCRKFLSVTEKLLSIV